MRPMILHNAILFGARTVTCLFSSAVIALQTIFFDALNVLMVFFVIITPRQFKTVAQREYFGRHSTAGFDAARDPVELGTGAVHLIKSSRR